LSKFELNFRKSVHRSKETYIAEYIENRFLI